MRYLVIVLTIMIFTGKAWGNERESVAATLAAEACGEGIEGMRLVAETIRNRSIKSGHSFYQVVSKKGQYYGFTAKNRAKLYRDCRENADKVANELFNGTLPNRTKGALYFRRPNEPVFKWCKIKTYSYKNHIFYK